MMSEKLASLSIWESNVSSIRIDLRVLILGNVLQFSDCNTDRVHPTISKYLHSPFAHRICSIVLQSGSSNRGEATRIHTLFARLVATFNLFGLNKKLMPRGASSCEELVIE